MTVPSAAGAALPFSNHGARPVAGRESIMTFRISEHSNRLLQASLPVVEAHRSLIGAGMAQSLLDADPQRGRPWAERAAASLVAMLVEQARYFASGQGPQDLSAIRLEHLRCDIGRRHYSRFGDALAPVMVDAAGAALPKPVGSAWCEAFWAVIGRMRQQEDNAIAVEHNGVFTGSLDAVTAS